MDDTTVEVTVGTVTTPLKKLIVSVIKQASGQHRVCLFISPKSGRSTGEIITMSLDEYEAMKHVLTAADAEIAKGTPEDVCPNCKVPQHNQTGGDTRTCAFCGFIRT